MVTRRIYSQTHPWKKPVSHYQSLCSQCIMLPGPLLPLPPPLEITNLFSVLKDLPIWGISYKWSHAIYGLWDCPVPLSIMFLRFIHIVACVSVLCSFLGRVIVHFMVIPQLVYPPVNWHLVCFLFLSVNWLFALFLLFE